MTSAMVTGSSNRALQHHTLSNSSRNSSTCLLEDAHCSLRGPGHALDGLKNQCILWDESCTGNNESAVDNFWKSRRLLFENKCFLADVDTSPECTTSNPTGRMSAFEKAKNWMRTPECLILHYDKWGDPNRLGAFQNDIYLNSTCCGNCKVLVEKVDVYFWPEPNADTSCESIIGEEVSSVADGATTDEYGSVYWGCTLTLPWDQRYSDTSTMIITTATLTSVASMQFKTYNYNPWEESPCGIETMSSSTGNRTSVITMSSSSNFTRTAAIRGRAPLRPRANSLIAATSASTAVVDGFTL